MRYLISMLPALLVCVPVLAQETDVTALQLKACTLIQDDALRIRCYDHAMSRAPSEPKLTSIGPNRELISVAPPRPTTQTPASAPNSSSNTPLSLAAVAPTPSNRSAGLDVFGLGSAVETVTSSAQKMLSSSEGPSDWQVKADNPNLQNASRLLAALKSTVSFGDLIFECNKGIRQASLSTTAFLGWEDVRARYHINAGPEKEARWPVAPNGRTVAIPEGAELLNSLSDGQILVVTLTDYSSVEHSFTFEVSAISGLRAQIDSVCHSSAAMQTKQQ